MKNQYREALERARREGKLVFVNFTGYACANCHWMKANMFPRQEIAGAMKDFVLVELYTDGTDEASRLNQQLQESKFATIAIPYYAILDPNEKVVASFPGVTRDPQEYLAFLRKGSLSRPAPPSTPEAQTGELAGLPLSTLEGGGFDTGSLRGKIVVMNFWATWCVPCIREIPSFNRMHQQLADKGVVVIGVSMDEDGAPLVKGFLKKHPMEYAVALGSEKVGQQFQVNQLPTTVVFDRSGKAMKRFEGFTPAESLEEAVKTAL
jgi:thiol:disulfide interchange protein DsbD